MPSCGARKSLFSLSLGDFRPLRQPLLPSSATGGGRKRSPARFRVPRVQNFTPKRKRKEPQMRLFSFWQGQKDLNPRHAVLEAQYMVVIVCYNHNR